MLSLQHADTSISHWAAITSKYGSSWGLLRTRGVICIVGSLWTFRRGLLLRHGAAGQILSSRKAQRLHRGSTTTLPEMPPKLREASCPHPDGVHPSGRAGNGLPTRTGASQTTKQTYISSKPHHAAAFWEVLLLPIVQKVTAHILGGSHHPS